MILPVLLAGSLALAHSVTLQRGPVSIVVVDNTAVGAEHKAGYNGLASLTHKKHPQNIFVPSYSGLNFELIYDGTNQPREVFFEPRRFPMELKQVGKYAAELHQAATANWQLESATRYELERDGTVKMTFECTPRGRTFTNDYIGLFWASYMQKPDGPSIHFRGPEGWIEAASPRHGVDSTHLGADDTREFRRSADFPSQYMAFSNSKHRYTEPFYYHVSQGMATVFLFGKGDGIRFTQSPSGGGAGNPALDFQWFVDKYEPGRTYRFEMRMAYIPYKSPEQILKFCRRKAVRTSAPRP